jgi:hypothetical protein
MPQLILMVDARIHTYGTAMQAGAGGFNAPFAHFIPANDSIHIWAHNGAHE